MIPSMAYAGETVVIVNKTNEVSSLSISDLQALFKGKKKFWGNGKPVILFLPPVDSESMTTLTKKVFKKNSVVGVSKYYLKAIFQQKFATPPESLTSDDEAASNISGELGGIALVEAGNVEVGVKVIKIDGF